MMKVMKAKYHLTKEKVKDLKADIENRRDYIGGSDIGTIMGCNPWKSRYTLWAEKTGLIEPEDISDIESVWWGVHLEDLVAERFTMKTGIKTRKSNFAYSCEEFPFLRGHVDRISVKGKRGLECKTTSSWNKTKYEEGEIPPMHWWQCEFYLFITGYQIWDLATKRDNQFFISEIKRDDEAIERMLEACQDFWNHVQNGEPVEIDESESTTETLEKMYPESLEGMSVDISEFETHLDALTELNEQKNSLSELQEKYKNEIKSALGEAERGETENYIVTWKSNVRGLRVFKFKRKG